MTKSEQINKIYRENGLFSPDFGSSKTSTTYALVRNVQKKIQEHMKKTKDTFPKKKNKIQLT